MGILDAARTGATTWTSLQRGSLPMCNRREHTWCSGGEEAMPEPGSLNQSPQQLKGCESDQHGMMREIQERERHAFSPMQITNLFFSLVFLELQQFQLTNEALFKVGGRLGAWSNYWILLGKGRQSKRGKQKQ